MVITMLRKTGGLLTKDDADFVDAGYCPPAATGGSTLSAALHFNCENFAQEMQFTKNQHVLNDNE